MSIMSYGEHPSHARPNELGSSEQPSSDTPFQAPQPRRVLRRERLATPMQQGRTGNLTPRNLSPILQPQPAQLDQQNEERRESFGSPEAVLSSSETRTAVEIYRGAEKTTPSYLRGFLTEHASAVATALKENDRQGLTELLCGFADVLPTDTSFRELASFIARRQNGNLFATTVEGDIDKIDKQRARMLLSDLIEALPADTEQLFFLHTHPSNQSQIGSEPVSYIAGFSEADKTFMELMGVKLRMFPNLSNVYVGLSTANSKQVFLGEGKNQGMAYGWSIDTNQTSSLP